MTSIDGDSTQSDESLAIDESEVALAFGLIAQGQARLLRAMVRQTGPAVVVSSTIAETPADAAAFVRSIAYQHAAVEFYVQLNGPAASTPTGSVSVREWLLIDCDPTRAPYTNSTDAELGEAASLADNIRQHLEGRGWPAPIVAVSGNGMHLLYRISLAANHEARQLIRSVLHALASRFDTDGATIDKTVFDAERLCRLYGTINRKALHSDERPQRLSRLLRVSGAIGIVTREQLQAVANSAPSSGSPSGTRAARLQELRAKPRLSVDDFCEFLRGVQSSGAEVRACCPAHADSSPSLSVGEAGNGRILIYCHAGCEFDEVLAVLGLRPAQLMGSGTCTGSRPRVVREPVAVNLQLASFASHAAETGEFQLPALATVLGVTVESLRRLQVGWFPSYGAWTIPERRADGGVIGVQLRFPNGRKIMMPNSHRGLILPQGHRHFSGKVYLPEGASDTAALLSAGLQAIGRPSANHFADLPELLSQLPAVTPVVVGDNDQQPDGRWPGRHGAERCAAALAAALGRAVEFTFPPAEFKDVRAWFNSQKANIA